MNLLYFIHDFEGIMMESREIRGSGKIYVGNGENGEQKVNICIENTTEYVENTSQHCKGKVATDCGGCNELCMNVKAGK